MRERSGDTTRKFEAFRPGGAAAESTMPGSAAALAAVASGWRGSTGTIEPGSITTEPRGLPPVNVGYEK